MLRRSESSAFRGQNRRRSGDSQIGVQGTFTVGVDRSHLLQSRGACWSRSARSGAGDLGWSRGPKWGSKSVSLNSSPSPIAPHAGGVYVSSIECANPASLLPNLGDESEAFLVLLRCPTVQSRPACLRSVYVPGCGRGRNQHVCR